MQTIIKFFKSIFLIDSFKGMWITLSTRRSRLSHSNIRPNVVPPPRFRGVLRCKPNRALARRPASSVISARRRAPTT